MFIVTTWATTAQPTPTPSPGEISYTTPLLFLGNQNIAPVIFLDGTTPKGVDVDIVWALTPHLSRPVEIKAMNWTEAQSLVAKGSADALIQINPTEERLKRYDFSDTLLESQFSIFTQSKTFGISGPVNLRGLRVGIESGGLPQKVLEKDPQIQLMVIPTFVEGFNQLNEGSLDAVVVDFRVGSYILAKNNIRDIKVTGEPVAFSNSSFAVKKGNTRLLNEINAALKKIKDDGSYQRILDSWKPTEGIFQTHEQITEQTYLIGILILLIVILFAILWIITIKKELTKRKAAEKKLKQTLDSLEEQVRERTAQLSDTNDYLVQEIEERKKGAQELRESENRYHAIYDQSPIAIELYDAAGNLVHVNPACLKLFGIDDIRVIKNFSLFADPNLKDGHKEKLHRGEMVQYQEPFDFEKVKLHSLYPTTREGTIWLDVFITPLGKKTDTITGFLVQIQDITERKKTEEGLKESEKRYHDMFEINNAVMLIIDTETTRIVDANAAAVRYYEYTLEELTRMLISEINIADPAAIKTDMSQAVKEQGLVFQFRHRKKSGEIRDVEVFSGPIMVKGKKFLHSIIQDVTERKRIEEALRQSNHKLNLLSSITRHDIGNELQIIFGYLGLVKDTELNPQIHEYIENAYVSSQNIERQLSFTRDYQDIGVHSPIWQDVYKMIVRMIKHIDCKEIQIHTLISGVEIFADPLMEKVFYNLIDNAKRYGDTITEIRFSGTEGTQGYTILCEDNGVGIPDEYKSKIFNREYFQHTGFGLNLSREILDITGITIQETGEPGKGARFEILVPKGKYRVHPVEVK
jgi:PAS domain S-box-containing protein